MISSAYAAEGGHEGAGGLPDPMHQFEIKRIFELELFGVDASFTNSALFMVIAACLITLFTVYAMRRGSLVPTIGFIRASREPLLAHAPARRAASNRYRRIAILPFRRGRHRPRAGSTEDRAPGLPCQGWSGSYGRDRDDGSGG